MQTGLAQYVKKGPQSARETFRGKSPKIAGRDTTSQAAFAASPVSIWLDASLLCVLHAHVQ